MLEVTSVNQLADYVNGVLTRAHHHAGQVNEVILPLLGAVVAFGHEIKLYGEGTKNVCWFRSRTTGQRYAFSYSHDQHTVVLRRDTLRGEVAHTFDNTTSNGLIKQIFSTL